jgi:cytochrome P450
VCGREIPVGVEVACSPYVLSRNAELYGEDVDEFRPERYLGDEEKVARMVRMDFVFGYGPRHCIGMDLSQFVTVKAVIAVSLACVWFLTRIRCLAMRLLTCVGRLAIPSL